jgi:hypothetical protein
MVTIGKESMLPAVVGAIPERFASPHNTERWREEGESCPTPKWSQFKASGEAPGMLMVAERK